MRAPLEASVTLLEATTPVKLPTNQCPHIHGLESKQMKGRISTAAPRILAYPLQSLRPILHITCPDSMISYSKGSRGLFVPSRVIGIFTDTTISLSSRLRQRPDHYTIRASRRLFSTSSLSRASKSRGNLQNFVSILVSAIRFQILRL